MNKSNVSSNDLRQMVNSQIKKAKKKDTTDVVRKRKVFSEYKDCPICHGTLYREDNGKPCVCRTKHIISKQLIECNVGRNYHNVSIDYYKEHFKKMKITHMSLLDDGIATKWSLDDFVELLEIYPQTMVDRLNDGRGFLISGGTGGGKTCAVTLVMKELCLLNYQNSKNSRNRSERCDYSMYFMDTIRLLDTIRDTYDDESETKHESKALLRKLEKVDLLVLDDLGAEYTKSNEWLVNIFLKIIKGRANNNKPTLITTNYSPGMLKERFSDDSYGRLSSVINEKFDILVLDGFVDARKQKKMNLLDTCKR